jgi:hypothetical protein
MFTVLPSSLVSLIIAVSPTVDIAGVALTRSIEIGPRMPSAGFSSPELLQELGAAPWRRGGGQRIDFSQST